MMQCNCQTTGHDPGCPNQAIQTSAPWWICPFCTAVINPLKSASHVELAHAGRTLPVNALIQCPRISDLTITDWDHNDDHT